MRPEVFKVNADYVVATRDQQVVGQARREGPGHPWIVSKIQWRGANGGGKIAGFNGGEMTIGTVDPIASSCLQGKLITAMLEAL